MTEKAAKLEIPGGAEAGVEQGVDAATGSTTKGGMTKYRDNALECFRNGALFDFRVRLGIELLAHGGVFEVARELETTAGGATQAVADRVPARAARIALDAASELVRLAEERGLVDPMGDPEHLPKNLKDHVVRQVVFQTYAQEQGQKRAKAIGSGVGLGVPFPMRPS